MCVIQWRVTVIMDKGHEHIYCIKTYLLCHAECDFLLRFTIFS